MEPRGRSKGRGFGRAQQPQSQQPQQPQPPQPQQPQQPHGALPSGSCWGRRPGPPPAAPTPYTRPPMAQISVRAVERTGGRSDTVPGPSQQPLPTKFEVEPPVSTSGGGGDASSLGRGSMRGRRVLAPELLKTRPDNLATKKGSTGERIMLQANYFKLLTTTDWCLYQYRVDFSPEEDRTVVRKGLLRLHKAALGAYIFDGTVLYTSARLPDKMELFSKRESDNTQIKINIRLVGDMVQGDHHYLQFFNIIMRKCLGHLNLQLIGRDYFDARSKMENPQFRFEVWPGYLTSIRQHEQHILMCAEIIHKVMRQETLLDILNECYNAGRDFENRYKSSVIGQVVLTDYNNNTYRVDEVHFHVTPESTFQLKSGENISYIDYYRNKYQIRISNKRQPMLLSQTKSRDRRAGQPDHVYLVPELCRATGLTDYMKNDVKLMRSLAQHTRIPPVKRIEKLMNFNRRLQTQSQIMQELKEWNLGLDSNLMNVPGRLLQPESIVFDKNGRGAVGPDGDWTRSLRDMHMLRCVPLRQWHVICSNRVKQSAQKFVSIIVKVANGLNFSISPPIFSEIRDERASAYTDVLEQIKSKSSPQLIFCVVPSNSSDRYSAIKKKCCLDRPVPTQVFLQKNLECKGVMSVATKVAIQINCKLGGAPWCVEIPTHGLMVVGFDVCHDTNKKNQDFGAMVASLDDNLTKYFSAVTAHTNGEELSNDLSTNLCIALQKYRHIHQKLPTRIIIYRDGVGEGQVPFVFDHEVERIKHQVNEIYKDKEPVKMAFIIVSKRINTRFFHNKNNPRPGTVVDDVVTNPVKYDFFIVSQSVREGTVSPTAYSVISDCTGWSADTLQRLTYKLTHMYYNCSATIRVPAPCQYAHKLAFLVAQAIHQPPSTQLDSLYFL